MLAVGTRRLLRQQSSERLLRELRLILPQEDFREDELRRTGAIFSQLDRVLRVLLCLIVFVVQQVSFGQALLEVPGRGRSGDRAPKEANRCGQVSTLDRCLP